MNRKIVSYKVVRSRTEGMDDFNNQVDALLKEGFELYGNLVVYSYSKYQTLVKYEVIEEPQVYSEERRIRMKE